MTYYISDYFNDLQSAKTWAVGEIWLLNFIICF